MMRQQFLGSIEAALDAFLAGASTGKRLVQRIDTLMTDELPDELPEALMVVLNRFQDELGLYVEDEHLRKEHPAYFGPGELNRKAIAMKKTLQAIRP